MTTKLTITITEDGKSALKRAAAETGLSISRIIQRATEAWLLEHYDIRVELETPTPGGKREKGVSTKANE